MPLPEPDIARLMQPEITVAAMLGYVRLRQPDMLPPGRYPALEALSARAEAHPAFTACRPTPGGDRRAARGGQSRAFALARRPPKPLGLGLAFAAVRQPVYRGFQPCASITIVMPTST